MGMALPGMGSFGSWLLPCVLIACGGESVTRPSGGEGAAGSGLSGSGGSDSSAGSGAASGSGAGNAAGSGAVSGSGGSGAASGSGAAGSGTGGSPALGCEFQGVHYEHGAQIKNECNWCNCSNGELLCTTLVCSTRTCTVDGVRYYWGDNVPSSDCNTCTCAVGSVVECTTIDCGTSECEKIESEYYAALAEAKTCNPALSIDQCAELTPIGMPCSCHTFTNPAHAAAVATMRELEGAYAENECALDIVCEPCFNPSSAFCSPEGRCEDRWDPPPGAGGVPGAGGAGSGLGGEGGTAGGPDATD